MIRVLVRGQAIDMVATLLVVWVLLMVVMYGALLVYNHAPGEAGVQPEQWPESVACRRSAEFPTLLVFAHPRCPCTLATLGELERLAAQVPAGLHGYAVVYRPRDVDQAWVRTAALHVSRRIPGLTVLEDPGGEIARSFGVTTSGHVVVYDCEGRLAFSGGVTSSRGHEGDNRGRDAVRHFLAHGKVLEARTAVFGCPIADSHDLQDATTGACTGQDCHE